MAKIMDDLARAPVPKQIAVGGAAGTDYKERQHEN